jgi:hypothetical protein
MSNAMIKPSREYLQIKSLADAHARMTPCEIGYQMNDLPQNLPKNIRLDEDATPRMGSKQIKFHPDTTFGMRHVTLPIVPLSSLSHILESPFRMLDSCFGVLLGPRGNWMF